MIDPHTLGEVDPTDFRRLDRYDDFPRPRRWRRLDERAAGRHDGPATPGAIEPPDPIPARNASIRRRAARGVSVEELAADSGLHRSTIRKILDRTGDYSRPAEARRRRRAARHALVRALRAAGGSTRQVSRLTGLSRSQVQKLTRPPAPEPTEDEDDDE